MITKEQLQAIINIVPDGWSIDLRLRGNEPAKIREIFFMQTEKTVIIAFTDDLNIPG